VLKGITGAKPVAEICREHQIAQTPYDQWRDLSAVPGTGRSLPGRGPAGLAQWDPEQGGGAHARGRAAPAADLSADRQVGKPAVALEL
jgi:hypothetical protein